MTPQQKLWDWCDKRDSEKCRREKISMFIAEGYTQKLLEFAEWANDNAPHLGKSKWERLSGNEYIKYTTSELFDFWIENELKLK